MSLDSKPIARRVEELQVKLNDGEIQERGEWLAQLEGELTSHALFEQQRKQELKAKRSELESKIAKLASNIRSKSEIREVEVLSFLDKGEVLNVRQDTSEVISRRPPRDDERQSTLFTDEPDDEPEDEDLPQNPTDLPEQT